VAHISTQNQQILDLQQADQFHKIVDWLSPPDPWTNHASARRHHEPETGEWLLHSDEYKRWKDGQTRHLWLHGKAGCGKTVLASTVIEDVRRHCEIATNAGLAVFYFSFSDSQKQSLESLLRSLVAQFGWKEPGRSILQREYEKPNQSLPQPEVLEDIFWSSIRPYGAAFLVLDGLDECLEGGNFRRNMLDWLERLSKKALNLRMFTTSRDLGDVRGCMYTLNAGVFSVITRSIDADIGRYVSGELSRDCKLTRLDEATKMLIMRTLVDKADGM
jgi:hypothetical protein